MRSKSSLKNLCDTICQTSEELLKAEINQLKQQIKLLTSENAVLKDKVNCLENLPSCNAQY